MDVEGSLREYIEALERKLALLIENDRRWQKECDKTSADLMEAKIQLRANADRIATLERQVEELQAKAKPVNDPVIVTTLTPEQTDRPSIIIGPHQPCHTFTAEAGKESDGVTVVSAKGQWMLELSNPVSLGDDVGESICQSKDARYRVKVVYDPVAGTFTAIENAVRIDGQPDADEPIIVEAKQ